MTSSGGRGIVVTSPSTIVDASLYTKAASISKEYRIHIWNGEVLDFIQKKKRRGGEASSDIRNHDNGWVFAREGVTVTEALVSAAKLAVSSLGLYFGAVDIGEAEDGSPYVFEVNTAPGLTGTTLKRYVEAIKNEIQSRR